MLKVKTTFLTLFILFVSSFSQADESLQHQEVLFSKVLNEERTITVQVPKSYENNKTKKYPVIYRLDGKENLPLISEVMQKLQTADSAPEVIMVAIENTDRARDFAPTVNRDPRGPVGQGGGADKFLDFLEQELIPHINKKYQTHDFKIISGASVAGLFTIHSLQSRPHLFQAHMAYSPAVWWGDRTTAKKTKAFISQTKSLNNYLYMNIGEEAGEMRAVYDDLHSHLQNNQPDEFKFISNKFNNVPHGLTSAAGAFHAYQNLFLPLRMPNRELKDGVKSIENYYSRLSQQRGETIQPPEWVIRELGYYLVNNNETSKAIELFEFNQKLYPELASAYNGLAYIYERLNRYDEALKQVNLALNLAKEGDSGYKVYINRRDRLLPLVEEPRKWRLY